MGCSSVALDSDPEYRTGLVCLADVPYVPVQWLWPERIPLGMVSVIAGEGGVGKSTMTLDMAARVSRGDPWPDHPHDRREPGSVIILSAEDGLSVTIRPRLEAAGADLEKVYSLKTVETKKGSAPFNLDRDLPILEENLKAVQDARLVIIDPVAAFSGGIDDHKNGAVRDQLQPLVLMAQRHNVAVVLVTHLNKSESVKTAHRLLGSVGYFNLARAVWLVAPDRDDANHRLMVLAKTNVSAKRTGLAFGIVDKAIRWEDREIPLVADDLLAAEAQAAPRGGEVNRATAYLFGLLTNGRMPVKRIMELGKKLGFTEKTLQTAKTRANIGHKSIGFSGDKVTYWMLPPEPGAPPADPTNPREDGKYAEYGEQDTQPDDFDVSP
jgi:hypothetical protein